MLVGVSNNTAQAVKV